jgi:Holliday junction resolvase RusA-like endonuclease
MMEQLGLTWESEALFSDYCPDQLFLNKPQRIKYTKEVILFCDSYLAFDEYESDDLIEWDSVEICPWENIIEFYVIKKNKKKKTIKRDEIDLWLDQLDDFEIHFPCFMYREGYIAVLMDGRPYSKSQKGKERFRNKIRKYDNEIAKILPSPTKKPIHMYIEVFSTEPSNLPDIDRFTTPIIDVFKNLIYQDDNQIRELKPRVFNTTKLLEKLELRSHPMGLYTIEMIPSGSLYPLCKGVQDYFVIRILYG